MGILGGSAAIFFLVKEEDEMQACACRRLARIVVFFSNPLHGTCVRGGDSVWSVEGEVLPVLDP